MNIFVLDPNPAIAAQYHCDQHLGKMILESAQMLSTVARSYLPYLPHYRGYYKPTHHNHPCTVWAAQSKVNCAWIIQLCRALDSERLATSNCDTHASMEVINLFEDDVLSSFDYRAPSAFVFAGPLQISVRPDLDVVTKYRKYYQLKHKQWLKEKGSGMTWNNRTVPEWISNQFLGEPLL